MYHSELRTHRQSQHSTLNFIVSVEHPMLFVLNVGVANCIARRTRSSPDRRVALVRAMRAPRRARHADRVHRAHDAP